MDRRFLNLALAASFTSVLAVAAAPAFAQTSTEKCYGVALAGQNDCAAGKHDCKHHSTADYDKSSFKLVPAGTCTTIKTPDGFGSLKPSAS